MCGVGRIAMPSEGNASRVEPAAAVGHRVGEDAGVEVLRFEEEPGVEGQEGLEEQDRVHTHWHLCGEPYKRLRKLPRLPRTSERLRKLSRLPRIRYLFQSPALSPSHPLHSSRRSHSSDRRRSTSCHSGKDVEVDFENYPDPNLITTPSCNRRHSTSCDPGADRFRELGPVRQAQCFRQPPGLFQTFQRVHKEGS
jgi:hypothetical protein